MHQEHSESIIFALKTCSFQVVTPQVSQVIIKQSMCLSLLEIGFAGFGGQLKSTLLEELKIA